MALTPETWAKAKEDVAQYTTAQQLDYIKYKKFLNTDAGRDWPTPASIADFLANIDKWAASMTAAFEKQAQEEAEAKVQEETKIQEAQQAEQEAKQAEYDAYTAEQRAYAEEARARTEYAAQEAYHEAPMYPETFSQWAQEQSDTSQALQAYIKSQYPSLQAEYKAEVGRLTGFPTREEARTEAGRRERGWESWLGERMPETTQEYYAQRPAQRGERLWMQAPTLRTVNW